MLTYQTTPNQEENLLPQAAKVKARVVPAVVREEEWLAREEEQAAVVEEGAPRGLLEVPGDKEEENHRTAKSRGKHRPASGVKSPVIPSIFARR